ncbi:L-serine ammonia-lyase [Marinomonas mediterranea]|jgi:L-serine ammonia-lyase (EC 4.3.1.17)|uniref:L-serine dehydratase n=1 Tax=Marinomonas mediterranea (strain ATCC 700492 / JCM 21426 / NBRC 103028 / MMB-1) TaxID=717774 RepID=F2K0G5_MARM1|nr:L-serine ammonia-lyase [Marinomonas mediterranea]ADZ90949.1 L-serine dehydratase 1 [Marinomonas mediterranea MMB-1]WCN08985.1 L-serine ammonia-lyase [Marinomonas mediterranea]WCN13019.1 L-serine ammonia-lyase [Marinomonas mediterranea]WCN17092.1 L-serine ammonia-lyase [Marinomonas mediterranea MMB-1]
MSISVFDLFKIGIGPSSSHTVGPMQAAADFREALSESDLANVARVKVELFGSLSATGKGHATDSAIILGLMGERPSTINPEIVDSTVAELKSTNRLKFVDQRAIEFIWDRDMCFLEEVLPYHPNAMSISAFDINGTTLHSNTYYSIGGGFVIDESHAHEDAYVVPQVAVPYDFSSAKELLALCEEHNMRLSELMMANEKTWRTEAEIRDGLMDIWAAMKECIANGLHKEGVLPGGLNVRRRAMSLHKSLIKATRPNIISSTLSAMDWVNLYALAVNEENAGGGRMVTAPTNGAAGIIPAVLMYFMEFTDKVGEEDVVDFLLAAAAIGVLCKKNASISGAEVGCQGEVGSACAMAAAGLCDVLGGTPMQVENAAEIGLEHNLGLTCDPVGGLVQVPCIERNAIAAMKAINATQMALRGDGDHFISLDKVIKTMRDTGRDMQDKYKETSRGGLAVNAIEC